MKGQLSSRAAVRPIDVFPDPDKPTRMIFGFATRGTEEAEAAETAETARVSTAYLV